jgi:hypothetical protein
MTPAVIQGSANNMRLVDDLERAKSVIDYGLDDVATLIDQAVDNLGEIDKNWSSDANIVCAVAIDHSRLKAHATEHQLNVKPVCFSRYEPSNIARVAKDLFSVVDAEYAPIDLVHSLPLGMARVRVPSLIDLFKFTAPKVAFRLVTGIKEIEIVGS